MTIVIHSRSCVFPVISFEIRLRPRSYHDKHPSSPVSVPTTVMKPVLQLCQKNGTRASEFSSSMTPRAQDVKQRSRKRSWSNDIPGSSASPNHNALGVQNNCLLHWPPYTGHTSPGDSLRVRTVSKSTCTTSKQGKGLPFRN